MCTYCKPKLPEGLPSSAGFEKESTRKILLLLVYRRHLYAGRQVVRSAARSQAFGFLTWIEHQQTY
jgi:hypothetical protein